VSQSKCNACGGCSDIFDVEDLCQERQHVLQVEPFSDIDPAFILDSCRGVLRSVLGETVSFFQDALPVRTLAHLRQSRHMPLFPAEAPLTIYARPRKHDATRTLRRAHDGAWMEEDTHRGGAARLPTSDQGPPSVVQATAALHGLAF
jgi:hypothetical protein